MLPHEIAFQLRQRGWDVESIQGDHTELMGVEDAMVLERSTAMGRTLVTDNVRHFMPLHERHLSEQRSHAVPGPQGLVDQTLTGDARGTQEAKGAAKDAGLPSVSSVRLADTLMGQQPGFVGVAVQH